MKDSPVGYSTSDCVCVTVYIYIYNLFLISKKQCIDQKEPRGFKKYIGRIQEGTKRKKKQKAASRKLLKDLQPPQQNQNTLPTPHPSQKVQKRICVINTIHVCPISQIALEISFNLLSKENPILERHHISFTP